MRESDTRGLKGAGIRLASSIAALIQATLANFGCWTTPKLKTQLLRLHGTNRQITINHLAQVISRPGRSEKSVSRNSIRILVVAPDHVHRLFNERA
jgi:hypothetical protein